MQFVLSGKVRFPSHITLKALLKSDITCNICTLAHSIAHVLLNFIYISLSNYSNHGLLEIKNWKSVKSTLVSEFQIKRRGVFPPTINQII